MSAVGRGGRADCSSELRRISARWMRAGRLTGQARRRWQRLVHDLEQRRRGERQRGRRSVQCAAHRLQRLPTAQPASRARTGFLDFTGRLAACSFTTTSGSKGGVRSRDLTGHLGQAESLASHACITPIAVLEQQLHTHSERRGWRRLAHQAQGQDRALTALASSRARARVTA
jgi:hypothetical protein